MVTQVFPVWDNTLFNDGYCFFTVEGEAKKARCISCGLEIAITSEIALDKILNKCSIPVTIAEIQNKFRNELPPPYMLYGRFARAFVNHIKTGAKARSKEEIIGIFNLCCKPCIYYDKIKCICLKCGCNVNEKEGFMAINKIAWESNHCDINKW